VQRLGQARDRPGRVDVALLQPSGLVIVAWSRQRLMDKREGASMAREKPVTCG